MCAKINVLYSREFGRKNVARSRQTDRQNQTDAGMRRHVGLVRSDKTASNEQDRSDRTNMTEDAGRQTGHVPDATLGAAAGSGAGSSFAGSGSGVASLAGAGAGSGVASFGSSSGAAAAGAAGSGVCSLGSGSAYKYRACRTCDEEVFSGQVCI